MQPSVLIVLSFSESTSKFPVCAPPPCLFFFFPHFLTFKPQVTPKPKIIVFWMSPSHMISLWTWPNESSSSTAPGAYEQSTFPSGSAEWQWTHTLIGDSLSMSKSLANISLFFSKYFWSYRRSPDYWIIFMCLETSVFKKFSSPPSVSVLHATG